MYHESTLHAQNSFITLTYSDAPPELSKHDLQCFFKRLRHLVPVRYFACGEYGTATHRPHYHAVIFGADFRGQAVSINDSLWSSPHLEKAWGKGLVSVGDVTIASCMYVAGYVAKKIGDPDTFNLMSRRPGIGHTWLDRYRDDIKRTGTVAIEGNNFPIPARYLNWYPEDFEALRDERRQHFKNLSPEQVCRNRAQLSGRDAYYKSRQELKKEVI